MPGARYATPFTEALERAGIGYELLVHPPTATAAAEAAALGLAPETVAKTIVLTSGEGNIRVVLPASERIDMRKLREALGGAKELHLLSEEHLAREYPAFELGAVPPAGGRADAVILDQRLAERDTIVVEAGTHDHSVRLSPRALLSLTAAQVADLCRD
jgi:Ala-tRNA(Pro) deacylase